MWATCGLPNKHFSFPRSTVWICWTQAKCMPHERHFNLEIDENERSRWVDPANLRTLHHLGLHVQFSSCFPACAVKAPRHASDSSMQILSQISFLELIMSHFNFQPCAKANECHFLLSISPFLSSYAMLPLESLAMLEDHDSLLIDSKLYLPS